MFKISISLIILNGFAWGQTNFDTLRCNRNALLEFYNNLDSLSYQTADKFLLTFDESCVNNAEYSEWSNELLYKFLENNPSMLIEILLKEKPFKRNYIYKNLTQPIHDGVDLKMIYSRVEKVNMNNEVTMNILKNIKTAINKL